VAGFSIVYPHKVLRDQHARMLTRVFKDCKLFDELFYFMLVCNSLSGNNSPILTQLRQIVRL
jgi:hypothetical protein